MTGLFEKLDNIEQRLKERQDKLDKEAEEEERKYALKTELESQMVEAIYAINDVDKEGLSTSSGSQTTTTRDSDGCDLDGSFSQNQAKLMMKRKQQ